MIRLTLILLAGIFATLSVAGRDAAVPTASGDDVAVTRALTDPSTGASERLALGDERGAAARALSATDSHEAGVAAGTDRAALWRARAEGGSDASGLPDNGPVAPAQAAADADLARVNADRVNLRAGPSTANQVLDQVVRDQEIRVLETRADGWARISVPESGLEAWIFGRFLSPVG